MRLSITQLRSSRTRKTDQDQKSEGKKSVVNKDSVVTDRGSVQRSSDNENTAMAPPKTRALV